MRLATIPLNYLSIKTITSIVDDMDGDSLKKFKPSQLDLAMAYSVLKEIKEELSSREKTEETIFGASKATDFKYFVKENPD